MKLAAIDFETATSNRNSACAVGAILFEVDTERSTWKVDPQAIYELIQPPDNEYDYFNIEIHGITPEMTEDADPFDTVWRRVEERIDGHLVVAHNTAFDMSVLRESAAWCEFTPAEFDFLCTYRLAKVTWPQMFSYRLDVLAEELGIELEQHHHAAHDALAAGLLAAKICEANQAPTLLEAAKKHGFKLGRFSMAAYKPFSSAKTTGSGRYGEQFRFKDLVPAGEVDESHPVHGVCFAFTGTLSSMTRKEAAQRVVDAGGEAHAGPTKTTNFLVVGMTDFTKVRDGMSGKMKKALDLADAGTGIEIIDEREFLQMFV